MGKGKRMRPPSSSSESEEEEPIEIELDMDDITRIAVLELLSSEEFKESFFSGLASGTEEQPRETNDYLKSIPEAKRRKLENMEKKLFKSEKNTIPLKYRILTSNLTDHSKKNIINKLNHYDSLPQNSSEYIKLKKYIEGLERIPFNNISQLPVKKNSNRNKLESFISSFRKELDLCTFGQEKAKMSITEIVAKWITNPKGGGNSIGLCGPPGIGKTSLIKNGLSKAIKVPFSFISLGGATCSSYLQGHDFTYEGSKWGRIVEILSETGTMNPIIFFDELDKISETKTGEEIAGILIHLTDPTQNNSFQDKYFSGIDFDLSKCFFIFSFNDKNKINPILKDRIKILELEGFKTEEKLQIAKKFSIPKICKNIGFDESTMIITDECIRDIVTYYCRDPGVRKLESCLESIIMRVNLHHITGDMKSLDLNSVPYTIGSKLGMRVLKEVFGDTCLSESIKMMYS